MTLTVTTLDDGYDCNLVEKPGAYIIPQALNGPEGGNLLLFVIGGNVGGNSQAVQQVFGADSGVAYFRNFVAGAWLEWVPMTPHWQDFGVEFAASSADTLEIAPRRFKYKIVTDGEAALNDITLGTGELGQRVAIIFDTATDAGDTFAITNGNALLFDKTGTECTDIEMLEAAELLLQWSSDLNGWQEVDAADCTFNAVP